MEHEQESLVTDMWQSIYPFMMMGWLSFVPYSEYRERLLAKQMQASDKPIEEIEQEMNQVIAQYESTRKAVS